jgi:hypothetical protein
MDNDGEKETTLEKGRVGSDAHPELAGELGDELVAPGEDDERGSHRGCASGRKTLMLMQALRIHAAPSN